MNKPSHKIRTYLKIIDYLQYHNKHNSYPTVKQIVAHLKESGPEFEVATRSVQRYIKDLSVKFAISIKKKEGERGYEINMEDTPDFNEIHEMLRISDEAGYFREMIAKPKESLQYICFDGKQFTGHHHIETIVDAIAQSKVIKFIYKKFDGGEKERKVKPYLLKEYNNRWYLVGEDIDLGADRNFGLDRIMKIEITDEYFDNTETVGVKERYEKIIGVDDSRRQLEEVVLKVDDNQVEYFRTYPWHKSQEIDKNGKGEWIVTLWVRINYELQQLILMDQAFVQVLRPSHLSESIKTMLAQALGKYS